MQWFHQDLHKEGGQRKVCKDTAMCFAWFAFVLLGKYPFHTLIFSD